MAHIGSKTVPLKCSFFSSVALFYSILVCPVQVICDALFHTLRAHPDIAQAKKGYLILASLSRPRAYG